MSDFLNKRKELVLGLLAVLLAFAMWRNFAGGAGGRFPGAAGAGSGRATRPELGTLRLYPVDWAALEGPRPAYDANGRNIFQFGVIPPPPPPVLSPAEKEAIRKAQEAAQKERARQEELLRQQQAAAQQQNQEEQQRLASLPPPPPPPPPRPQPPVITYKFIGYIGPPDRKIAVLHDGGDVIFVRAGEDLPKGIRVLEVGYESIKFGFSDPQFKDESRTLPMSSSY